jgi:hypothetical protein
MKLKLRLVRLKRDNRLAVKSPVDEWGTFTVKLENNREWVDIRQAWRGHLAGERSVSIPLCVLEGALARLKEAHMAEDAGEDVTAPEV